MGVLIQCLPEALLHKVPMVSAEGAGISSPQFPFYLCWGPHPKSQLFHGDLGDDHGQGQGPVSSPLNIPTSGGLAVLV